MGMYAAFSKVEPQDDGTIKVFGIASSETADHEGEVISADAMRKAMPEYMASYANVREMHQPNAIGKGIEGYVDEDGVTHFGAHIVDPVAVSKVKHGVLQGFSIAGKAKRDPLNKALITEVDLTEISLVDRPCNPDAKITMWKVADMVPPVSPQEADATMAPVLDTVTELPLADATDITPVTNTAEDIVENKTETVTVGEVQDPAAPQTAPTIPDAPAIPEAQTQKVDTVSDVQKAVSAREQVADMIKKGLLSTDEIQSLIAPKPRSDLRKSFTEIKKGMCDVSQLSGAISSLRWIVESAKWEAEHEGDNSPVPAMLIEAVRSLATAFLAMAQEEVSELMADLAGEDDVAKLFALVPAPNAETISKGSAIAKVEDFAEFQKLQSAYDDLKKVLETTPKPNSVSFSTVSKSSTDEEEQEVEPVRDAHGNVDEAATLVKKVFAAGKIPLNK